MNELAELQGDVLDCAPLRLGQGQPPVLDLRRLHEKAGNDAKKFRRIVRAEADKLENLPNMLRRNTWIKNEHEISRVGPKDDPLPRPRRRFGEQGGSHREGERSNQKLHRAAPETPQSSDTLIMSGDETVGVFSFQITPSTKK